MRMENVQVKMVELLQQVETNLLRSCWNTGIERRNGNSHFEGFSK
jgi:hypothetical protein